MLALLDKKLILVNIKFYNYDISIIIKTVYLVFAIVTQRFSFADNSYLISKIFRSVLSYYGKNFNRIQSVRK